MYIKIGYLNYYYTGGHGFVPGTVAPLNLLCEPVLSREILDFLP